MRVRRHVKNDVGKGMVMQFLYLQIAQMGVNMLLHPREEVFKTTSSAPTRIANLNSLPQ
jgi:hypothetical protein